jgi:hypothetical protein
MVILNRNSTELSLNHLYLQIAYLIQLTVKKFVQPQHLYTSRGGKIWAGSARLLPPGFSDSLMSLDQQSHNFEG